MTNLLAEHGDKPLADFHAAYPGLDSIRYDAAKLDLSRALRDADVVIVHEWNDHDLVARIGKHRARHDSYKLLFHDTHHRAVTDAKSMGQYDLRHYDGILAFGEVLRKLYLSRRWTRRAWTWHEAADTRLFRPIVDQARELDLVWVGNWGDEERTAELHEFLLRPIKKLKLKARFYGVRYPDHAKAALADAGIEYGNWLPNFRAPDVFARAKVTAHVPRRPYTLSLPGIPTIRVFEALACGIPLICAPWNDAENLFTAGLDFLVARNGGEMVRHLTRLLDDAEARRQFAAHGHKTVLSRHTCAHRVDELIEMVAEMNRDEPSPERKRQRPTTLVEA